MCGGGAVGLTVKMRDGRLVQTYECIRRRRYQAARELHKGVRGRWAASFVEAVVRRWAFELMTNTEAALASAQMLSDGDTEAAGVRERDLARAQKELATLDEEERRVKDRRAWYDTREEYDEALSKITQRRAELQALLAAPAPDTSLSQAVGSVIALRPASQEDLVQMLADAGVEVREMTESEPTPEQLEAYWSAMVRRTITAVWLERDGETITVEGALPEDFAAFTAAMIAALVEPTSLLS